MKDKIQIRDHLTLVGGDGMRFAPPVEEKEAVQVRGFVSMVCRERGKLVYGTRREGFNIWTLSGREHLAQLQSYNSYGPDLSSRNDRIKYIGFGTGSTPEVSSVSRLVTPIAFDAGGNFLAALALPNYPLAPSRTSVQYTRSFSETELSVTTTVILREVGIFTDGNPAASPAYNPGSRVLTFAAATSQAPNGYKTFEPLKKTQSFVLELAYEVRF